MKDIEIKKLGETDCSLDVVTALLHKVFSERVKNGMNFAAATINADTLKEEIAQGEAFIAEDKELKRMVGFAIVKIVTRKNQRIAYLAHLAVDPDYQRSGIASRLFSAREKYAIENNCVYIRSNTAEGAKSSVRYHLKNGFKKVEYNSFVGTDYYSIIFRKQLQPSFFWNNSFLVSVRYHIIFTAVRLLRKADGSKTLFGKIIHI